MGALRSPRGCLLLLFAPAVRGEGLATKGVQGLAGGVSRCERLLEKGHDAAQAWSVTAGPLPNRCSVTG